MPLRKQPNSEPTRLKVRTTSRIESERHLGALETKDMMISKAASGSFLDMQAAAPPEEENSMTTSDKPSNKPDDSPVKDPRPKPVPVKEPPQKPTKEERRKYVNPPVKDYNNFRR